MMLTLPHPRGTLMQLSLGCLQLRLRAVPLVPGLTGTFRACWSQGRARGCWSPRAGECRAASSSVPGQDEGEHPRAALLTCPLSPLCPRPSLAPRSQGREGEEPGCEGWDGQGSAGHWHRLWAHLNARVSLQGEPALLEGVLLGEPVSHPVNPDTPITPISPH